MCARESVCVCHCLLLYYMLYLNYYYLITDGHMSVACACDGLYSYIILSHDPFIY